MHELVAPAAYRGGVAEKAARDILIKHRAAKAQLKFGSVFQYLEEKGETKIQTSVRMILAVGCYQLGRLAHHLGCMQPVMYVASQSVLDDDTTWTAHLCCVRPSAW